MVAPQDPQGQDPEGPDPAAYQQFGSQDWPGDIAAGQDPGAGAEGEPGLATHPNPADSRHQMPEDPTAELNRQMNAMLTEFTARLVPNITKMVEAKMEEMDKRVAGAIAQLSGILTSSGNNGNGNHQDQVQVQDGDGREGWERILEGLMPVVNIIANKFGGGGAAGAGSLAGFEQQFAVMSNLMNIAKGTLIDTHMESVRTGMKMTADAYTWAFKAGGQVPDNTQFNAMVDGTPGAPAPAADPAAAPAAAPVMAQRRPVVNSAITPELIAKLIE